MNLQVCAPHQECVYNCPFCVARGHKHKYQFKDIYNDGLNQDYFNALKRTIKTCVILTPLLSRANATQLRICDVPAAVAADDGLIEYIKKYRVICGNAVCFCHQQTRLFSTPEKAIEAWNRRVDND